MDTPRPSEAVPPLRAVIFDVDGTLADTERDGHRPAFNAAFAEHGLDVQWQPEEYGRLLRITGGRNRVAAYLREHGYDDERADELAAAVHGTKTELFRRHVQDGAVAARPGLAALVTGLGAAGVRIAVATTGRRDWVEPLVGHLLGSGTAEVTVAGDDVAELKPDPAVYRITLERLGLTPKEVLAIEDSEVGLRAAQRADLATIVVTNGYTVGQDFSGAAAVLPGYDGPDPLTAERCVAEHHRWWARSLTPRPPAHDMPGAAARPTDDHAP